MLNKFQWAIQLDNFDGSVSDDGYISYSKKLVWISDVKMMITTDKDSGEAEEYEETVDEFKMDDMLQILKSKKLDISQIKTLHLDSGCTIPRFKLKSLCDKYKLAVKKQAKDADIIVLGNKSFNKKFSLNYSLYMIPKQDALEIIKTLRNIEIVDKLEAEIQALPCEWMLLYGYGIGRALIDAKKISQKKWNSKERIREIAEFKGTEEELATYFDPSNNYYYQDKILELMTDGVVIDQDVMASIIDMLKSKDGGNVVVAMEIMSNCNYEKSIVYLWLLFKNYYNQCIADRKERTYVNFKSLMQYLGFRNGDGISLDSIIDNLVEKKLWTRANMNILLPVAQNEIQEDHNTGHLKIQKVDVSDELKAQLQEEEVVT